MNTTFGSQFSTFLGQPFAGMSAATFPPFGTSLSPAGVGAFNAAPEVTLPWQVPSANDLVRNAGRFLDKVAALPFSMFASSTVWTTGGGSIGKQTSGITPKLLRRIQGAEKQNLFFSRGFYNLLSDGDMLAPFAEMLAVGLGSRLADGAEFNHQLITEVIGKIREPENYFSNQFKDELALTGKSLHDYFVAAKDGERNVVATIEEPEDADEDVTVIDAEFDDEDTPAEGTVLPTQMVVRDGQTAQAGGELALVANPAALAELGLPATALTSLARISPDIAHAGMQAIVALKASTNVEDVANGIRFIREFLYERASPEERRDFLRNIADVFLKYDPTKGSETKEHIGRIKDEIVEALTKVGIRPSFVSDLGTFITGNDSQKVNSLVGLAASLTDDRWKSDEGLVFARYLVVRMVLAEIKRGSSPKLLATALDCVHAIAPEIIDEKQVDNYIDALLTRSGSKDQYSEQSVVYTGLTALIDADKEEAIASMERALRPNAFSPTDVLLARILIRNYEEGEKKDALTGRMAGDFIGLGGLQPSVRRALMEGIAWAGVTAIPIIISEYNSAKSVTTKKREEIVKLLDEITSKVDEKTPMPEALETFLTARLSETGTFEILANMKVFSRKDFAPQLTRRIYERAADVLHSKFAHSQPVKDGVISLDDVRGTELLSFLKAKSEGADNDKERIFYIAQMVAKIASLEGPAAKLAANISWTVDRVVELFEEFGSNHFDLLLEILSSPAVPSKRIQDIYTSISKQEKSADVPGRDRKMLIAMAGNAGLPESILAGTVGDGLVTKAGEIFGRAPAENVSEQLTVRKRKPAKASVTISLKHRGAPDIVGVKVAEAITAFVSERNDRFAFDPRNGKLMIRGIMTSGELSMLKAALSEPIPPEGTHIIGAELKLRIGARLAQIDELSERSKQADTTAAELATSLGGVPTIQLGGAFAADVLDGNPREAFEQIVQGIFELFNNESKELSQEKRDYFLEKLLELHDELLEQAGSDRDEKRRLDDWSYMVVKPLTDEFIAGRFNGSTHGSRVFKFIVAKTVFGVLKPSSRKHIFKMISDKFSRFRRMAPAIKYFCAEICKGIRAKPAGNWEHEKAFLIAARGAFGAEGSVVKNALGAALESAITDLLPE